MASRRDRDWLLLALAVALLSQGAWAQAFNLDFGTVDDVPPPDYAAAGAAGIWIGLTAPHGSTTHGLTDVDGNVTSVSVRQLGGTDNLTTDDPATTGSDELLMDDYLVTYSSPIETCLFFENLSPGTYEVLIYAWVPAEPAIDSFTSIDQEPGNPHHEVGGPWPGGHLELTTFSRHTVEVAANGILNLHSGIVPGANPALGAALNAVQIRPLAAIFADGFESGDTAAWSATVP